MQKRSLLCCWVCLSILNACSQVNDKITIDQDANTATVQHTAINRLNWIGTYKGIVPCPHCSGIETELTLDLNHQFVLKQTFLGASSPSSTQVQGTFKWVDSPEQMILLDSTGDNRLYRIGNNFIEVKEQKSVALSNNILDLRLTKSLN